MSENEFQIGEPQTILLVNMCVRLDTRRAPPPPPPPPPPHQLLDVLAISIPYFMFSTPAGLAHIVLD